MVVQCDQCNAKFKLDDSKIKPGGVKVRCAKCKHIFQVMKEQPQEEDFDSILKGLDDTSAPAPAAAAQAAPPVPPPAPSPSEDDFNFEDESLAGASAEAQEPPSGIDADKTSAGMPSADFDDFQSTSFDFGSDTTAPPPVPAPDKAADETGGDSEGLDFGDFNFSEETPAPSAAPADDSSPFSFGEVDSQAVESATIKGGGTDEADSFDFGDFSFGESEVDKGEPEADTAPEAPSFDATVKMDSINFDDFPPIGEEKASATPAMEEDAAFSFNDAPTLGAGAPADDKGEEFSFGEVSGTPAPPVHEPEPGADNFDFGNFDFGETPSLDGKEEPETPKPSAMAAPGLDSVKAPVFSQELPETPEEPHEEEMPPLSITGRRKLSRSVPFAVVGAGIAVCLLLVGGGYYLFTKGTAGLDKIGLGAVAKWIGGSTAEEGKIAIAKLAPSFIANKEAGELFVINGQAINNYKKARASIQVKAVIYGPNGEIKLQKTAYCGNALSADQLATMPLQKIEAAMSNQFGDSLANLGIQPGKSIPFTVVFTNVPKDAGEFGVEVVNSTVASQ